MGLALAALVGLVVLGAISCKNNEENSSGSDNICKPRDENAYVVGNVKGMDICKIKGGNKGMLPLFTPVPPVVRSSAKSEKEEDTDPMACQMSRPLPGQEDFKIKVRVQVPYGGEGACADNSTIPDQIKAKDVNFSAIASEDDKSLYLDTVVCMAIKAAGKTPGIHEVDVSWREASTVTRCIMDSGGRIPDQGGATPAGSGSAAAAASSAAPPKEAPKGGTGKGSSTGTARPPAGRNTKPSSTFKW